MTTNMSTRVCLLKGAQGVIPAGILAAKLVRAYLD